MRRLIFTILLISLSININAQITLNLTGVEKKSDTKVLVQELSEQLDANRNYVWEATVLKNGTPQKEELGYLKKINFSFSNLTEFWKVQGVKYEVYEKLVKNGMQYDLRKELEDEALQYLEELEKKNLFFNDSYLENYLYTITYKLFPGKIQDGRPGIVNLKVVIDNTPNSYIFPNGTMIITTGLLTTINSEDELIAVMAHEISHFVLDHTTININKANQRKKAAEFWAAFATTLATASEVYLASKNDYYTPGALTYSTAILSTSIADAFIERLGLEYSREQEMEADKCAVELMKYLNINPLALSSVLTKIKNYCVLTGDYYALSGKGTHPALQDRINAIGTPTIMESKTYDKLISLVISMNAGIEFNKKHFDVCINLINRNIAAGVAIEDDYILKAMSNLCMYDNVEKNQECLNLLKSAKEINVIPPIYLYKQEALVYIRLKNYLDAKNSLQTYLQMLTDQYKDLSDIKSSENWSSMNIYLTNELDWTKKMLFKIKDEK
ncbi:MAG: M48 family metallopeptidase [Bacteroidota bacterium]|nr:M48 family metallopeptidase [Bacteroidota bacterium]